MPALPLLIVNYENNINKNKSFDFPIRIVKLYQYLNNDAIQF